MTLIEAVKSGKRFKRKDFELYYEPGSVCRYSYEDIVAEDWEIEEDVVTITKSKFYDAVAKVLKEQLLKKNVFYEFRPLDLQKFEGWDELLKELGLE